MRVIHQEALQSFKQCAPWAGGASRPNLRWRGHPRSCAPVAWGGTHPHGTSWEMGMVPTSRLFSPTGPLHPGQAASTPYAPPATTGFSGRGGLREARERRRRRRPRLKRPWAAAPPMQGHLQTRGGLPAARAGGGTAVCVPPAAQGPHRTGTHARALRGGGPPPALAPPPPTATRASAELAVPSATLSVARPTPTHCWRRLAIRGGGQPTGSPPRTQPRQCGVRTFPAPWGGDRAPPAPLAACTRPAVHASRAP